MFIILVHYIKPITAVEKYFAEHHEFLDRHYAAGRFVTSGPQVPRTGGVILARANSRSQLDEVLSEDPFYREKVAQYQVIEFSPNKFAAEAQAVLTASPAIG
jgi:uncharacterized protein YciI